MSGLSGLPRSLPGLPSGEKATIFERILPTQISLPKAVSRSHAEKTVMRDNKLQHPALSRERMKSCARPCSHAVLPVTQDNHSRHSCMVLGSLWLSNVLTRRPAYDMSFNNMTSSNWAPWSGNTFNSVLWDLTLSPERGWDKCGVLLLALFPSPQMKIPLKEPQSVT